MPYLLSTDYESKLYTAASVSTAPARLSTPPALRCIAQDPAADRQPKHFKAYLRC